MKKLILLLLVTTLLTGCAYDGVIDFNDCREVRVVSDSDLPYYRRDYTCMFDGDKKRMCVSRDVTDHGECIRAYMYEEKYTPETQTTPDGKKWTKINGRWEEIDTRTKEKKEINEAALRILEEVDKDGRPPIENFVINPKVDNYLESLGF